MGLNFLDPKEKGRSMWGQYYLMTTYNQTLGSIIIVLWSPLLLCLLFGSFNEVFSNVEVTGG